LEQHTILVPDVPDCHAVGEHVSQPLMLRDVFEYLLRVLRKTSEVRALLEQTSRNRRV
jgi:hypothetical protein